MDNLEQWKACCRASNRLADLVCAMYHPRGRTSASNVAYCYMGGDNRFGVRSRDTRQRSID